MREKWTEFRIDELGDGRRPVLKAGPFGSAVTKATYQASGYKVYGQQEVVAKDLKAEAYFVSEETFRRHKGCQVKPGDLLMTMMGTIGRVYRVPEGAPEGIINPRLVRIALDSSRILPEFAEAALTQPTMQRLLDRRSHGGTMQGLNLDAIATIRLQIPPLPEQRKIVSILRTWDEALHNLTALRAKKMDRHRAMTRALVFGSRQLDRFTDGEGLVPHRWFKLPKSWGYKPIGKLAKEISERNSEAEQHEVLSCSKRDGFVRSLEYFKKQIFSADLSGYKKIWRGDFGFPCNHVEEGSIGLQNLTDIGLVSPIYAVFRFAPEIVDADYAIAVFKTEVYRHIFEVNTSASVDRRGSLRWSEFAQLPFPVPTLMEQKAIAEVIQTARAELDLIDAEIEAINRQKRGLMHKLLNGEWSVHSGRDIE